MLAPPLAGQVLASARQGLRSLGLDRDDLEILGPPLPSAQAAIYFLGTGECEPLYVAKISSPASGGEPITAQYEALKRCHAWWDAEDAHAVARPIALMADCDGMLMQHVAGRSVVRVLRSAASGGVGACDAAKAAGDFLRRFHRHARVADAEVELSALAGDVLTSQAEALGALGLSLPDAVTRTLDRVPARSLVARRVLLHGDYAPRNLILIGPDQVAMLDPVLEAEGHPEDDVASFLTLMSSDSSFAAGLVFPPCRRTRLSLERAFLTGYGPDNVSSAILGLRLIDEQMWRWAHRRRRGSGTVRGRLIDAQMRALLTESAAQLDRSLAALT